ncbi:MAG: SDR family oxidoreductase [Vicinamibacteria bacterium]|nr:SDR family oxidoreductase [Vicinamibacteria bacterium]
MKVLFIGGTGAISSACAELAARKGVSLTLFCRGRTDRPVPKGVDVIRGDIREHDAVRRALGDRRYDAVVDWIAFTPEHVEADIELFRGKAGQYVFVSSASVYQTPPSRLPVLESTVLDNPVWAYSRAKIACEERLIRAYRDEKLPVTIVRPSHTYDARRVPAHGGWTVVERMRRGKPVVVHGDGTSLWVLTHSRDFAKGLVPLLGNPAAIGETFHITSDEALTWNQIYLQLGRAAGVEPKLVHAPSSLIAAVDRDWGDSLLGDKTHSMIFDNGKIKRFAPEFMATTPFVRGVEEIVAWHDADPSRRAVDPAFDRINDRLARMMDAARAAG